VNNDSIRVSDLIEKRKVGAFQYQTVILCGLVLFIDGFDTQALSYIMPLLAKEWHLPPSVLGSVFSSTLIGLMVGYLFLSSSSDKFGHKRMIVLFTFLFGLFTVATVLVTNVQELIVLRFLTGMGLGAVTPSAVALTGEYSPQRLRASFVLAIYCGFSLGFVAASFAAGELLPRFGWTSLLWVGGLVPIALSVLLWFTLPESLAFLVRSKTRFKPLAAVLRHIAPDLKVDSTTVFAAQGDAKRGAISSLFKEGRTSGTLLLWLVFFINLAVFYFMQSWLPAMLTALKYPMHTIVWLTALPTIGGILAAFVVGPAMDRIGPYIAVGVLYLCGGVFVSFAGIAFSSTLWVLMTAIFLAGFCVSGGQKSAIALAAVFYPAEIRSTGVGWALGIGRLGGIAGPSVVGLLLNAHWLPEQIFYGSAVMILCAAVGVLMMGRLYGVRKQPKSLAGREGIMTTR
jgi:AAHS family 4-hydroxybenzoate transporter-like MFS transporter